jgi:hypothetical protein
MCRASRGLHRNAGQPPSPAGRLPQTAWKGDQNPWTANTFSGVLALLVNPAARKSPGESVSTAISGGRAQGW